MTINTSMTEEGKRLTIKIDGKFDFSLHQSFRDAYANVDPESTSFTLDLTKTTYMDSSAFGMLLVLRERAGGSTADITLSGYNPTIGQLIDVAKFGTLFKLEEPQDK